MMPARHYQMFTQGRSEAAWGWRGLATGRATASAGIAAWKLSLAGKGSVPVSDVGVTSDAMAAEGEPARAAEVLSRSSVDGVDRFSGIVAGAGTAGCVVADWLAKWMDDHHVPGTVLLVDRGVG